MVPGQAHPLSNLGQPLASLPQLESSTAEIDVDVGGTSDLPAPELPPTAPPLQSPPPPREPATLGKDASSTSLVVTVASVLRAVTHYAVLKIKPAALKKAAKPKAKVSAAFRKASLRVHPDKADDPRAGEAFVKLTSAYRVLYDPLLRAAYDDELRNCRAAKRTSSSAQQAAKSAFEASMFRQSRERSPEMRQRKAAAREAAQREKMRDAGQSKKDEQEMRVVKERVKMAQKRVEAAKRRHKQQQELRQAAETNQATKRAFGASASASSAAAEKAAASAAQELAQAEAACAAASAAAERLAFAAMRANGRGSAAAAPRHKHGQTCCV
jgi:curved DNA-binding protein CbpA